VPKEVKAINKKENSMGLERQSAKERVAHFLSTPSTKVLIRMNIMHGLACK